jgi:NADH:ubiquinone oxidoreductase subunit 6 (subunit J)
MLELNVQSIAFLIFSVITLGGALALVTNRNLIHAAVWLIVSLFGVAGLFVLLSAPFLAAVQVLVYIGAIAILIIFSVMLTRGMTRMKEIYNRQWALSLVIAVALFAFLLVGIILPVWGQGGPQAAENPPEVVAGTAELGVALVDGNQYVLPFEVASLLLTAAMIGAIVIARDRD